VTCTAREFSSYTRLAISLSVKTADGMDQPVVSKGMVKYTNTLTLSKVLHAPSFPINLLSINDIVLQLNCIVLFDISKVIFREKKMGGILGTGTWRSSLWYMDREGNDSALSSIVERSGGHKISVEDLLLLHHKRLGHPSFSLLSRLYPRLFEKTNENNFFCDACELGKHIRSSYVSSGSRSSSIFELVHSDVWGLCPTITFNGF
jgi:GAG-pre-integrase domain